MGAGLALHLMEFTRIVRGDVTEALIKAAEEADDMRNVLVLYEAKDGKVGGVICNSEMTSKDAVYLCGQFNAWIFSHVRSED